MVLLMIPNWHTVRVQAGLALLIGTVQIVFNQTGVHIREPRQIHKIRMFIAMQVLKRICLVLESTTTMVRQILSKSSGGK